MPPCPGLGGETSCVPRALPVKASWRRASGHERAGAGGVKSSARRGISLLPTRIGNGLFRVRTEAAACAGGRFVRGLDGLFQGSLATGRPAVTRDGVAGIMRASPGTDSGGAVWQAEQPRPSGAGRMPPPGDEEASASSCRMGCLPENPCTLPPSPPSPGKASRFPFGAGASPALPLKVSPATPDSQRGWHIPYYITGHLNV